ncbi:uncharacterized protein RCH25_025927 [Pelodytes ibericus]
MQNTERSTRSSRRYVADPHGPSSVDSPKLLHTASVDCPNDSGEYLCIVCNETFDSKSRLDSHRQTHVTKKPFMCSHCGRGFHHEVFLQMHERSHEDGVPRSQISTTFVKPTASRMISTRSSKAIIPVMPDKVHVKAAPAKYDLPTSSLVQFKRERPGCHIITPTECVTRLTRGRPPQSYQQNQESEKQNLLTFRISKFSDTTVHLIDAFGNSVELLTDVFNTYANSGSVQGKSTGNAEHRDQKVEIRTTALSNSPSHNQDEREQNVLCDSSGPAAPQANETDTTPQLSNEDNPTDFPTYTGDRKVYQNGDSSENTLGLAAVKPTEESLQSADSDTASMASPGITSVSPDTASLTLASLTPSHDLGEGIVCKDSLNILTRSDPTEASSVNTPSSSCDTQTTAPSRSIHEIHDKKVCEIQTPAAEPEPSGISLVEHAVPVDVLVKASGHIIDPSNITADGKEAAMPASGLLHHDLLNSISEVIEGIAEDAISPSSERNGIQLNNNNEEADVLLRQTLCKNLEDQDSFSSDGDPWLSGQSSDLAVKVDSNLIVTPGHEPKQDALCETEPAAASSPGEQLNPDQTGGLQVTKMRDLELSLSKLEAPLERENILNNALQEPGAGITWTEQCEGKQLVVQEQDDQTAGGAEGSPTTDKSHEVAVTAEVTASEFDAYVLPQTAQKAAAPQTLPKPDSDCRALPVCQAAEATDTIQLQMQDNEGGLSVLQQPGSSETSDHISAQEIEQDIDLPDISAESSDHEHIDNEMDGDSHTENINQNVNIPETQQDWESHVNEIDNSRIGECSPQPEGNLAIPAEEGNVYSMEQREPSTGGDNSPIPTHERDGNICSAESDVQLMMCDVSTTDEPEKDLLEQLNTGLISITDVTGGTAQSECPQPDPGTHSVCSPLLVSPHKISKEMISETEQSSSSPPPDALSEKWAEQTNFNIDSTELFKDGDPAIIEEAAMPVSALETMDTDMALSQIIDNVEVSSNPETSDKLTDLITICNLEMDLCLPEAEKPPDRPDADKDNLNPPTSSGNGSSVPETFSEGNQDPEESGDNKDEQKEGEEWPTTVSLETNEEISLPPECDSELTLHESDGSGGSLLRDKESQEEAAHSNVEDPQVKIPPFPTGICSNLANDQDAGADSPTKNEDGSDSPAAVVKEFSTESLHCLLHASESVGQEESLLPKSEPTEATDEVHISHDPGRTVSLGSLCLLCGEKLRSYRGEISSQVCRKCRQKKPKGELKSTVEAADYPLAPVSPSEAGENVTQVSPSRTKEICEERDSEQLSEFGEVRADEVDAATKKMYSCHQCDKAFQLPALLAGHVKCHTLPRCLTCGRPVRFRYKVRRIPRRCHECARQVRKQKKKGERFVQHESTEEEKSDNECALTSQPDLSQDVGTDSSSKAKPAKMKLHQTRHWAKKEVSSVCMKPQDTGLPDSDILLNETVGDTAPKVYKCSECSVTFKRPIYLEKHMRKHMGSWLYGPFTSLKESDSDNGSEQRKLQSDVPSRSPDEKTILLKRHRKQTSAEHGMERRTGKKLTTCGAGVLDTGTFRSQENSVCGNSCQLLNWKEGTGIPLPSCHKPCKVEVDEVSTSALSLCKEEDTTSDSSANPAESCDKPHACPHCGKFFQFYRSLHLHVLIHTSVLCESCGCRLRLKKRAGRRSKKCRLCRLQEKDQSMEESVVLPAPSKRPLLLEKASDLIPPAKKPRVMKSTKTPSLSKLKKGPKGMKPLFVKGLVRKPGKGKVGLMPLHKPNGKKKVTKSGESSNLDHSSAPFHLDDLSTGQPGPAIKVEDLTDSNEQVNFVPTTSRTWKKNTTKWKKTTVVAKKRKYVRKSLNLKVVKDLPDDELCQVPHVAGEAYQCSVCPETFGSQDLLTTHCQSHIDELPFCCTHCPQRFQKPQHLKVHTLTHVKARPYRCPDCNKSFTGINHLNMHRRVHMGIRPYSCPDCPSSFRHKVSLLVHRYSHAKTLPVELKPFQCAFCSKRFIRTDHLEVHQRVHTGECPFQCQDCDKTFPSKARLTVHSRMHSGVRPHTCPTCERSFIHKANLERHQQKHSSQPSFTCDQCDVRFPSLETLAQHKQTHRDEKVFWCLHCTKRFLYKNCLLKHQSVCQGVKKGKQDNGQTRGVKRKKSSAELQDPIEQGEKQKKLKGIKKTEAGVKPEKEGKILKVKKIKVKKEKNIPEGEPVQATPKEKVGEGASEKGKKKTSQGKPPKATEGKQEKLSGVVKVKKEKTQKSGDKVKRQKKEGAKPKEKKPTESSKLGEEKTKKSKVGIKRGPYKKRIKVGVPGEKKVVRVKVKGAHVKLKPGPKKKQEVKEKK